VFLHSHLPLSLPVDHSDIEVDVQTGQQLAQSCFKYLLAGLELGAFAIEVRAQFGVPGNISPDPIAFREKRNRRALQLSDLAFYFLWLNRIVPSRPAL
jgi:hypothetical protein